MTAAAAEQLPKKPAHSQDQQLALVPNPAPDSILTIIERAVMSPEFDVAKLQQLLELRERWERTEARKAFVSAMNRFKSEPTRILKNKHVHFETSKGPNDYNHATLDHVCAAVIGGLSKHGISHRWKVEQDKEWIKVTCILTHELGHAEETTLMGTADNTGSKNSIQAVGSTVTYLQRYTLLAATGLAAAETDTDGRTPNVPSGVPEDRVIEQCDWLASAKDLDELKALFRNAYSEADAAKDRRAQGVYIAAKDRRKRELQ